MDIVPQFAAFVKHFPKTMRCCDEFDAQRFRQIGTAMKHKYIRPNAPWARAWLVFDVDKPEAMFAWLDAGLPVPTFIVINPKNGHVHLYYALTIPVPERDVKAMRFFIAVYRAMNERLGGDEAFNGCLSKTPYHPAWETLVGPRFHTLTSLAKALPPGLVNKYRFRSHAARKDEDADAEFSVEALFSRNCAVFDRVRKLVYPHVISLQRDREKIFEFAIAHARKWNARFERPLAEKALKEIANSIAKWCASKFHNGKRKNVRLLIDPKLPLREKRRQAALYASGRKRTRSIAMIEWAEKALNEAGEKVTVAAVCRKAGVSRPTYYAIKKCKVRSTLSGNTRLWAGVGDGVRPEGDGNLKSGEGVAIESGKEMTERVVAQGGDGAEGRSESEKGKRRVLWKVSYIAAHRKRVMRVIREIDLGMNVWQRHAGT